MQGEPPQHGPPLRAQVDDDPSAIPSVAAPDNHPSPRETID
jgi:hypothetical protein